MKKDYLTADKSLKKTGNAAEKAKNKEASAEKYAEDLVAEIKNDFISRREKRAPYERQWDLNLSFFKGEQYKTIDPKGELADEGKDYLWQGREVYNHIAPIVEARLSKFLRVRPSLAVRPENSDADEITNARLAEKNNKFRLHGSRRLRRSIFGNPLERNLRFGISENRMEP